MSERNQHPFKTRQHTPEKNKLVVINNSKKSPVNIRREE